MSVIQRPKQNARSSKQQRQPLRVRPRIEHLEDRAMLSATMGPMSGGPVEFGSYTYHLDVPRQSEPAMFAPPPSSYFSPYDHASELRTYALQPSSFDRSPPSPPWRAIQQTQTLYVIVISVQ